MDLVLRTGFGPHPRQRCFARTIRLAVMGSYRVYVCVRVCVSVSVSVSVSVPVSLCACVVVCVGARVCACVCVYVRSGSQA